MAKDTTPLRNYTNPLFFMNLTVNRRIREQGWSSPCFLPSMGRQIIKFCGKIQELTEERHISNF
jgi:hypothetical protein